MFVDCRKLQPLTYSTELSDAFAPGPDQPRFRAYLPCCGLHYAQTLLHS
jgi:hypothetical protein